MSPALTPVEFAHLARTLVGAARRLRLTAPSFRSPPRLVGVDRTVRRHQSGAVVAVRLRGRPWAAVTGDMIEGIIVANELRAPHADRARAALWASLGADVPSFASVA